MPMPRKRGVKPLAKQKSAIAERRVVFPLIGRHHHFQNMQIYCFVVWYKRYFHIYYLRRFAMGSPRTHQNEFLPASLTSPMSGARQRVSSECLYCALFDPSASAFAAPLVRRVHLTPHRPGVGASPGIIPNMGGDPIRRATNYQSVGTAYSPIFGSLVRRVLCSVIACPMSARSKGSRW